MIKKLKTFLGIFLTVLISSSLFAEPIPPNLGNFVPGSIEPGVIGNVISTQTAAIERPPQAKPPTFKTPEEKAPSPFGPEAAKIKFKLTKIIIEGNKAYCSEKLLLLYQDKLNKSITITDLENIVKSITNQYRNDGYILSQAILPPQRIKKEGVVHIRVIEGYIAKVDIKGHPKLARYILRIYGNRLIRCRPFQIHQLESYLNQVNQFPGLNVKAVLEPSKTETGASDLTLLAEQKTFGGYLAYDNYGTRFLGPNQVTASVIGNALVLPGDTTRFTTVRTSRPQELIFYDVNYQVPIGGRGVTFLIGANQTLTEPGLNLRPLKTEGDAANFYAILQNPVIQRADENLILSAGANYIDTGTNIFGETLYNDHIRSANVGLNYACVDRFKGSNSINAHLEQGFYVLGATGDRHSPFISRFGADGRYTKGTIYATRLQSLFWRFSAFFIASGQYSFDPLLAVEQIPFGGSILGRGYDPAEILGDRGAGGSAELRIDAAPGWCLLQSIEPYIFYDAGIIWNIKNILGVQQKQSITSAGVGVRLVLLDHLSANLMLAQPLTRQVFAEQLVGRGRDLRGFFSVVLSG